MENPQLNSIQSTSKGVSSTRKNEKTSRTENRKVKRGDLERVPRTVLKGTGKVIKIKLISYPLVNC